MVKSTYTRYAILHPDQHLEDAVDYCPYVTESDAVRAATDVAAVYRRNGRAIEGRLRVVMVEIAATELNDTRPAGAGKGVES